MTPRDIVKAAIHHHGPERLPVLQPQLGVCDRVGVGPTPPAGWTPAVPGQDEWGCIWHTTGMKNMGQPKGHPLETLPDDLSTTRYPDYDDESRYVGMAERVAEARATGKYVTAGIFFVLWERMHALRGFENALCDLLTDRPAAERLADHIVDVNIKYVHQVARRFGGQIDGFTMTDDWGTQQAAFISYELWMEIFHPRYKRLFDAMHEAGCDVWVHSCGKVNEIIEGYIAAGVDVVNLQQPRALGIEAIGERYGGRIAFESLCDIQATLPTGDRDKIEADVEALMTHWASADGGFLFSDYGDNAAIGVTDPATKPFMYACFSRWSEKLYGTPLPPMTVEATQ
ncbi:MAG: uroporphyrinogen decarboxylase family protein [Planctomycetota bacterium]